MLNLKEILTKLCRRVNYRVVTMEASSATTVNPNSTAWIAVPMPSTGNTIGIVGYYINGTYNTGMNVYCLRMLQTNAQIAVRNTMSNVAVITPQIMFLVVD